MGVVLESTSLEWLSLGIILVSCVYLYYRNVFNFWKKKGVKYVEPVIPFGNSKELLMLRKSLAEFFKGFYDAFPNEPYMGIYEFNKPALLIRDPELIRQVLIKDFVHFQDRGVTYDEELEPLSAHLLFLTGSRWKNLRAKLTPTFTSGKIKMMYHLMEECAQQLKQSLDKPATNQQMMEMKEVMAKFTTDVIGTCAFGLQFNAIENEDSEFRKMGRRVFTSSFRDTLVRIIRTVCPSVLSLLKIKVMPQDIEDFFVGAVKETVEYREKNNYIRNDFMQLLIQLKNKGRVHHDDVVVENLKNGSIYEEIHEKATDIDFSDKLLTAQAFIFFLAGFETSSTTLSFCLYELALNPDIQDKLRDSIKAVVNKHGGKVTYDSLNDMPYLDKVVKETLRKHPPASFLVRNVTKPYVVPGTSLKLEAGLKVLISVYGMHRDAKYFPDPERFNPENFSSEAKSARPHYSYLPFGEGPRICIGKRFGLLQTKLGLATLLLNYAFSVCEKTEIPLRLNPTQFITSSSTGAWLRIKKCTTT
ncbi:hypothetical protein L9F63_023380 [Diploptera punctata]|uniref:Cytochrome P450 n=1 Tax=Diploptera punctata TaxID=6984 RepID=A0AAD7ZJ09_DIPPU|nr:hypothetical protein L9F63_023380 [Diploptera punctata]